MIVSGTDTVLTVHELGAKEDDNMSQQLNLRVWLRPGFDAWAEKARATGRIGDPRIEHDKSTGWHFIEVSDPHDPLLGILPKKIVRMVTIKGKISVASDDPRWEVSGQMHSADGEAQWTRTSFQSEGEFRAEPSLGCYVVGVAVQATTIHGAVETWYAVTNRPTETEKTLAADSDEAPQDPPE